MVEKRSVQVLLPFAFWVVPDPSADREAKGLYEMRSYTLRPGTLIEWGQAWYICLWYVFLLFVHVFI